MKPITLALLASSLFGVILAYFFTHNMDDFMFSAFMHLSAQLWAIYEKKTVEINIVNDSNAEILTEEKS